MKFFSVALLVSGLLVVGYSYGAESDNKEQLTRKVAFSDKNEIHEIKKSTVRGGISLNKEKIEQEATGPYNDIFLPDTCCCDMESCCCFTMAGVLGLLWISSKQTGEILLNDKKTN